VRHAGGEFDKKRRKTYWELKKGPISIGSAHRVRLKQSWGGTSPLLIEQCGVRDAVLGRKLIQTASGMLDGVFDHFSRYALER
jgi:hypothetical protein